MYLISDLYLEYRQNSHDSVIKRQSNQKWAKGLSGSMAILAAALAGGCPSAKAGRCGHKDQEVAGVYQLQVPTRYEEWKIHPGVQADSKNDQTRQTILPSLEKIWSLMPQWPKLATTTRGAVVSNWAQCVENTRVCTLESSGQVILVLLEACQRDWWKVMQTFSFIKLRACFKNG